MLAIVHWHVVSSVSCPWQVLYSKGFFWNVMRKRGMSDVFKYILVLIGGIALLIFFISFGLKGAKLIKNVNAIEMSETLNDYFNAMNPSENLVTNAEINSK